ncbi:MAG: DapH/DapD/GlmU-related protein [Actinocatenispora sp.]
MVWRRRDPRQARFLTMASLRWVLRHRAFTPHYLLCYLRFARRVLLRRDVVAEGFVFLGRRVELTARPGHGRIVLGRWVHIGDGCAIRAHEGTVRLGDKAVLGTDVRVNGYLDIEIGAATLIADWVYVCDFDHVTTDLTRPIKDQGIVKSPVRIGPDCWLGTKTTVTRGVRMGRGSVLAANAVATRDIPDYAIMGGVPARLLRSRRPEREGELADVLHIPDYPPVTFEPDGAAEEDM